MADAEIKYPPYLKVGNLAVKRSGTKYTAKWKVPSDATKKSSEYRFEDIYVYWTVDEAKVKAKSDPKQTVAIAKETTTKHEVNLDSFKYGKGNKKKLTRKSFHPFKGKPKVDKITAKVIGKNGKGFASVVKNKKSVEVSATASFKFKLPREPKVTWSYNQDNGNATVTVKTDAGKDECERHDTMVYVEVKKADGSTDVLQKWASTTDTSWSRTYDASNYGPLGDGKTIRFTARAYARGIKGCNPDYPKKKNVKDTVSASYTVSYPGAANINGITLVGSSSTGTVVVELGGVGARASEVKLQRRHGEDGLWEDVQGGVDNGTASYLYDTVGMAEPIQGEKLYYRIVSTRHEYQTASEAVWAECLYTAPPSAESLECGIVSLASGDDGRSAVVVVGWNGTDSTGTEVTWSEDPYSWESTKRPDSFSGSWEDAESQSGSWGHTMTLRIADLDEGATYYVRARRFTELETGTVYSSYAMKQDDPTVTPSASPTNVELSAPPTVCRGEPIPLYWTYDGGARQVGYLIDDGNGANVGGGSDSLGSASIMPEAYGDAGAIDLRVTVITGGGASSSKFSTVGIYDAPTCEVYMPPAIVGQPAAFTVYSDSDAARVLAKCESHEVTKSEPDRDRDQLDGDCVWTGAVVPQGWHEVAWADTALYAALVQAVSDAQAAIGAVVPTYQPSEDAEAQAGKEYFAMSSSSAYVPTEDDAVMLDKTYYELDGGSYVEVESPTPADLESYYELVVTDSYDEVEPVGAESPISEGWYEHAPEYAEAVASAQAALADAQAAVAAHTGTVNAVEVQLPSDVDFVDGGRYTLDATVVSTVSGLSSAASSTTFDVAWEHQAPAPPDSVAVSVDQEQRTATIALPAPTGAADTDVYDLYRQTRGGFEAVRLSVPMGAVVTDRYPAFGDQGYRVCTRTADGDLEFSDYPYSLPCSRLRFDWAGGHVELAYGVTYSDSSTKRFEARPHLDGGTSGYWRGGTDRTGSYGAIAIKAFEREAVSALQSLAEHPGPVFCRTPRGDAFQCNVDVTEADGERTMLDKATFGITRVDITPEFMVSKDDVSEAAV